MIEGQLYYIIKKLNQNNQEGVYDDVENALIAIMGFIDAGCDDANEMGTIKRNNMLNKMDIAEKTMHYLNYDASTLIEVRRKFLAQVKT